MKTNKRKFMPTSLEKRFMAIFLLGAALSWATFRYLRLIPALRHMGAGADAFGTYRYRKNGNRKKGRQKYRKRFLNFHRITSISE